MSTTTLPCHLNNDELAALFASQEHGRAACLAVLTYELKQGRKWEKCRTLFATHDAAQRKQEFLAGLYGDEVRNFCTEAALVLN